MLSIDEILTDEGIEHFLLANEYDTDWIIFQIDYLKHPEEAYRALGYTEGVLSSKCSGPGCNVSQVKRAGK